MGRRFQGGVSQKTCRGGNNILSFGTKAQDRTQDLLLKSVQASECWLNAINSQAYAKDRNMKRLGIAAPVHRPGTRGTAALLFWALFVPAAVQPVQAVVTDTIHLREVAVIGSVTLSRSPLITGDADTLSMVLMSGQSLTELLGFQPAIHIKSAGRGALATASFRGTDASHTKVFWNGMRLNSPMLGQVDFSQIPVWIIDQVSILYGGSSLREGSGALGGAILLENSEKAKKDRFLSLNQEISSFGTLGTQGRLSAGDGKIRTVTRLYWNRSLNDYPFLNDEVPPVGVHRLSGAAYEKGGVFQELYLHPGRRQDLSVQLWYHEGTRDLPPVMSYEGPPRHEKQDDRNLRTSAEWKFKPGIWSLSLRSGFSDSRIHYLLDPGYLQSETRSREKSFFNTLQAGLEAGSAFRLELRADYNRHDAGITDLVNFTGYRHLRNEGGITVSARSRAGRGWVFYGLLRQEWADGTGLPLMPSAGFSYETGNKITLSLKGNLARNYNLPSLNDLFWVPGGNPGLRPEHSMNGDFSLEMLRKGRHASLKAGLNLFAADVRDWILWKPTQFWYWEAENISHVLSRGADLQLGSDLYLGEWILSMKAGYAYTRSTNEGALPGGDKSRGGQLIYIPLHSSSSQLTLAGKGWFMRGSLCTTGRRWTQPGDGDQDVSESPDSYTLAPYALVDLHLGKSWKIGSGKGGLRFSVYNLFNVSYQAVRSRPMPMRSFAITIQFEL